MNVDSKVRRQKIVDNLTNAHIESDITIEDWVYDTMTILEELGGIGFDTMSLCTELKAVHQLVDTALLQHVKEKGLLKEESESIQYVNGDGSLAVGKISKCCGVSIRKVDEEGIGVDYVYTMICTKCNKPTDEVR